jgi:hypothetical protein
MLKRTVVTFLLGIHRSATGYLMQPLPFGSNTIGRIYSQFENNAKDREQGFKKYNSQKNDNTNAEKKTAIFLPAILGNSATGGLYDNFLNIMTRKNFDVYIPDGDLEPILDDINDTQCEITLISHSASALTAISMSNAIESIRSLVLIDPLDKSKNLKNDDVKSRTVDYDIEDINKMTSKPKRTNKSVEITGLERLLVFKTKKSDSWNMMPFVIPIGMFALKLDRLSIDKTVLQDTMVADEFGHFDILDDRWSNMMHNTVSKGANDRHPIQLELFRAWVANKIDDFTNVTEDSNIVEDTNVVDDTNIIQDNNYTYNVVNR